MDLLRNRDLEGIVQWVDASRAGMRTLNALTFDQDPLTSWRAIEAIGRAAKDRKLSVARDLVRRQFWTMTEESGGTAWRAPEVIGEILFNQPDLIKEFGVILSSFFKEEPFERGAYWAVARTAPLAPDIYQEIVPELLSGLDEEDPFIRIQAVLALSALKKLPDKIPPLKNHQDPVILYDVITGDLKEASLAEILANL